MTLSINKLEKMLSPKNIIVKNIYSINNLCVYLELLHLNTAETLFLYIPTKYEISVGDRNNVYKLNYLEVDEDGTIPADYADQPDDYDMSDKYDEIGIDNTEDIEQSLSKKYDCPISLKNTNKNDMNEIKEIFRQLKRLKIMYSKHKL